MFFIFLLCYGYKAGGRWLCQKKHSNLKKALLRNNLVCYYQLVNIKQNNVVMIILSLQNFLK